MTASLFDSIGLGHLTLPNRVVMAPMTRSRAGVGRIPTELTATYYAQRASAGLIITEATQISDQAVGYPSTPGLHTGEQVAGWRRVTDAVHEAGGRIFVQLWHVGRISHPSMQPGGQLPVAPSPIAPEGRVFTTTGLQPFVTPRALETAEIAEIVRHFGETTRRAREAGFDGVEVHGANGYLLDQFLRSGANARTDEYGGAVENRARLLLEVVESAVNAWEPARIGVRLSPTSPVNSMSDADPLATSSYVADALNRFGLAYLHVIEPLVPGPSTPASQGPPVAAELRRRFRGPFMINGGYDRASAESALASGAADLVAFGVPYIANPDLVERLAEDVPLAAADPKTFYTGGERGYTDYPTREMAGA